MNSIPPFHNFREACEHLETGGRIRRYGNSQTYYQYFKCTGGLTRVSGGMMRGPFNAPWSFSLDEQLAIDWVLETGEE